MKCHILSHMGGVLIVVSFALNAGEERPGGASPKGPTPESVDVRALLEAGQAVNSLPPNVVLRVEADLSKSVPADSKERTEAEARGVDFSKRLQETWEFTSNHVHRVVVESLKKNRDEVVYRRIKSLPFDSRSLCRDLLDGKILAIAAGKGSGKPLHFAGTDYDIGHRTIEILVNGKSALQVGESCLFAGFAETDARDFAALYEQLATQARAAFQAKPDLSVPPKKNNEPSTDGYQTSPSTRDEGAEQGNAPED